MTLCPPATFVQMQSRDTLKERRYRCSDEGVKASTALSIRIEPWARSGMNCVARERNDEASRAGHTDACRISRICACGMRRAPLQ